MAISKDPYKISKPSIYLTLMTIFLILTGFILLILSPQITTSFYANPGLNSLIICVLCIGILLSFWQVFRLYPEIKWVNGFRMNNEGIILRDPPRMLAPMATLLRDREGHVSLSPQTVSSILESIAIRLEESREIIRYMIGLLVFLGLLGTFWGLTETINAISQTIDTLDTSNTNFNTLFDSLKTGLAAPLEGMGTAFASSLFGLAASLILGFLDLQAGQAQNRFYTELEDWISTFTQLDHRNTTDTKNVETILSHIHVTLNNFSEHLAQQNTIKGKNKEQATTHETLSSLADGIKGLALQIRSEQTNTKELIETQRKEHEKLSAVLDKLNTVLTPNSEKN